MDGARGADHLSRMHRKQVRESGGEDDPRFGKALSLNASISFDEDLYLIGLVADNMQDLVATELAEVKELHVLLIPIMADLKRFRPQHHRAVSTFVTGENNANIANEFGVSESRVSQLKWEGVNFIKEALVGTPITPPRKRGKGKNCKGPGCTNRRPGPTGRRGRPAVYCSDECKRAAVQKARNKKRKINMKEVIE